METYVILKACFLGKENDTVKLNERQASNLLAGGFIEQQTLKQGGKK